MSSQQKIILDFQRGSAYLCIEDVLVQRNVLGIVKQQIKVFCVASSAWDRLFQFAGLTERLAQPKRLHPIQLFRRYDLNILDPRVSARGNPTMSVERLEYLPSPLSVLLVTC